MQLAEINIFQVAEEETGRQNSVLCSELFSLSKYTLGGFFDVIFLCIQFGECAHCPASFKITFLMGHSFQGGGYSCTCSILVGITFEYSNEKMTYKQKKYL